MKKSLSSIRNVLGPKKLNNKQNASHFGDLLQVPFPLLHKNHPICSSGYKNIAVMFP